VLDRSKLKKADMIDSEIGFNPMDYTVIISK
jgi:hypothetical protein